VVFLLNHVLLKDLFLQFLRNDARLGRCRRTRIFGANFLLSLGKTKAPRKRKIASGKPKPGFGKRKIAFAEPAATIDADR